MTWLIGMASAILAGYSILVCCPFENEITNIACRFVFMLVANTLLMIANDKYDKLKSRIKALEDKVENNEQHIYQLSKKQSNKTIEYYVDCDEEDDK